MNTTNQNEASAPANVRPSVSKRQLPKLDFKLRKHNRQLDTQKLLALLQNEAPEFWRLAHIVGQGGEDCGQASTDQNGGTGGSLTLGAKIKFKSWLKQWGRSYAEWRF